LRKKEKYKQGIQGPIAKRVVNCVLKLWIEKCPHDFNDRLVGQLNLFIDNMLTRDGHISVAQTLRTAMRKHINDKGASVGMMFVKQPPEPNVDIRIFTTELEWDAIHEEEIARQLTMMHFDIFKLIRFYEFLNKSWCDPRRIHNAPNIVALRNSFEETKLWVATSIIKPKKVRHRGRTLEKFIKIAKHLKNLNNFQTLFAVLGGIEMGCVQRLGKTMNELSLPNQTALSELCKLVPAQEGECESYKEMVKISVGPDGVACLPYIDILLRDILHIEHSLPDNLSLNIINFQKRSLLYDLISQALEYQRRFYNLQPVYQVQTLLHKAVQHHKPENVLLQLSTKREN